METFRSKDYTYIEHLADEMYVQITKRDIDGIIRIMNTLKSKIEFELLSVSFYQKYQFSLYNKIWNFINIDDYKRINLTLRKSLDR